MDFNVIASLLTVAYVLAIACIFHVLQNFRTAQAAVAWIVALISFPYITVFLYFFFGRSRFEGYVAARRIGDAALPNIAETLSRFAERCISSPPKRCAELDVITELTRMPFTCHNQSTLLIDGRDTFDSMFEAIHQAKHYILLEFFIVRDDCIGNKLSQLLLDKLADDVAIYFLYDDLGSVNLSNQYIEKLIQAGAHIRSFNRVSKRPKQFQINFRNHRKILIVDGLKGFLGGLNIGDEYLGLDPQLSPWRDTHIKLVGPAVLMLQVTFIEDWYWSANTVPQLNWEPDLSNENKENDHTDHTDSSVLIIPSSAADVYDTAELFFLNSINHAKERIWIATPYFVPDLQLISALQLAALKGIDVRIIIPENPDNWLVYFAGFSYLEMAEQCGVKIYRYQPGFMHQKVMLVDDRYACVGTANMDNRSMRLNFEVIALICNNAFIRDIEAMLLRDLACSKLAVSGDYTKRSVVFRMLCRAARLMAPLL